jgi:hypothetical protein
VIGDATGKQGFIGRNPYNFNFISSCIPINSGSMSFLGHKLLLVTFFGGKTLTYVTLNFTETNRTTIVTPSSTPGVTLTSVSVDCAGLSALYVLALLSFLV